MAEATAEGPVLNGDSPAVLATHPFVFSRRRYCGTHNWSSRTFHSALCW
jgi:hypothetical protein